MTRNAQSAKSDDERPFSSRAVQLEVLADALQHPATLYPFGLGCLSGIYALFFSPFLGGALPALALGLGAGVLSAGSFAWRYLVQGEQRAREKARARIAQEEARRTNESRAELEHLCAELRAGFAAVHSPDGRQALQQLADEWARLQDALERSADQHPFAADEIARSAQETYRQGLGVLALALELLRAIEATDRGALEAEAAELQSEIASLSRAGGAGDRVRVKQEILASHRERLHALDDQELQVEKLLQEADLAETALQHARVALPTLRMGIAEHGAADVARMLEHRVDQARRMQQRLRGDAPDEDERAAHDERERVR